MSRIEELKKEMKCLMDLEVVRMKIRHSELMWDVVPKLILAAIGIGFLIWLDVVIS